MTGKLYKKKTSVVRNSERSGVIDRQKLNKLYIVSLAHRWFKALSPNSFIVILNVYIAHVMLK